MFNIEDRPTNSEPPVERDSPKVDPAVGLYGLAALNLPVGEASAVATDEDSENSEE